MVDRMVNYFDWEFERVDPIGVLEFVLGQHPELENMQVPIKAYEVVEHGTNPDELVELVNVNDLRDSFGRFRSKVFGQKAWTSWQAGVGGVFYEAGSPKLFVPMIDLELTSTENLSQDMSKIEKPLAALNIDGSLIKSGDTGRGGYFFIGHEPEVYTPHYWQFMGKVLNGFTYGESQNAVVARDLGQRLLHSETLEESQKIADLIHSVFPSTKTGTEREGLLCDPRWIGYRLKVGFTLLRQTPGKSYDDRPLQVAGYY